MAAVMRDLAASPLAERFEFTFLDTWRGDASRLARLPVFAAAILRLAIWCVAPGARVVHVHTAVRGSWYRKGVIVVVGRLLRRPVVLQVHSGAGDISTFWSRLGPLRRGLVRRGFAAASEVLSVSEAGARAIRECLGLREVVIVRNAAPEAPAQTHDRPLAGHSRPEVLYLGGFANPAKGGHVIAAALPGLLADGAVSVSLAGPGEPPPALSAVLGSARDAKWLGWLDDSEKEDAVARADMVVLPSISEGMPIALLEAMVAGRAIVAARTGAMPELLTHGVDALLVPAGDHEALVRAVRALADDPVRRRELGVAAAARAKRLNREEVYRPLAMLYDRLAARPPAPPRPDANGHRPLGDASGRGRAVLVCSPGGHLQQMLALRPAWQDFDVSWATLTGHDSEHILAGERVDFAHGPTNRNLVALLRNVVFAARVIRRRRPDVIVSTGAGLAVPMFVVGRLLGVRLVYVESLTRTEGLSLSGRLVAPLAHDLFVQWPGAMERGARYVGSVLTDEPPVSAAPREHAVGTTS